MQACEKGLAKSHKVLSQLDTKGNLRDKTDKIINVHDKLNKKEFLERVQKGAEQLLKLEKKTGKVAKRWAKAKKKIASRAEVLAVVEKTEKDFTASAKKMRDAVAKLKPVGAKAKHVTNKL